MSGTNVSSPSEPEAKVDIEKTSREAYTPPSFLLLDLSATVRGSTVQGVEPASRLAKQQ